MSLKTSFLEHQELENIYVGPFGPGLTVCKGLGFEVEGIVTPVFRDGSAPPVKNQNK